MATVRHSPLPQITIIFYKLCHTFRKMTCFRLYQFLAKIRTSIKLACVGGGCFVLFRFQGVCSFVFRKVRDTAVRKLKRGQTRNGWGRRQGKENRHSLQSFSRTLLHRFLVCPRFSFRAARLTSQFTKYERKTHQKTACYAGSNKTQGFMGQSRYICYKKQQT